MNNLTIEVLKIDDLKPYKKNAKKHPKKQIERIANSIESFGMCDPVGIWGKDNIIIEGHGRLEALKQLGYDEVPCIRLDHLTDEERKAYTLAHNKVAESEWDFDLLNDELNDIYSFDMEDFGFEFVDEEKNKRDTQNKVEGILNLNKATFPGVGKYDIPQLATIHENEIGEIKEWIGFNYVLSDKEPEGKAVHFFIDDYQFQRVFNNPDKYIKKLQQYECVLSPDFSPYCDMPHVTQIFNHYRKHWCARYFQENGIKVIPTIRCSTDERSLEWYLDGEPCEGVVAYSSMWIKEDTESYDIAKKEWCGMIEKLKPTKVFLYGKEFDFMKGVNIEKIETFTETMRKRMNNND